MGERAWPRGAGGRLDNLACDFRRGSLKCAQCDVKFSRSRSCYGLNPARGTDAGSRKQVEVEKATRT